MPIAAAAPAIIGAVGAVGGSIISSRASSKAAKQAGAAQAAQLDFDMERYDDWKNIFGGVQENLSNYYNSISPDYYVASGLEAFEKEREAQMGKLNETLAQRGLSNSGLAATVATESAISSAEARASIRREAPRQAREDQSRFLQIGMGQNPGSSVSSTLGGIATNAQTQANQASQAAGQAVSTAVSSTGKAIAQGYEAWTKANEGGTDNG